MPRILIIANPVSGRGKAARLIPRIERQLALAGCDTRTRLTRERGDAMRLAAGEDAHWADGFLSVGGDGTLNEIINGRRDLPLPVGVIPMGTGNVAAKEFGVATHWSLTLAAIAQWRTRTVDLAKTSRGERFLSMLGAGFDARAVELLEEGRNGSIHKLQYISLGGRALRDAARWRMRVVADGETLGEEFRFLNVANCHCYGGPLELVSQADPADGMLDVMATTIDMTRNVPVVAGLALTRQFHRVPGTIVRRARAVRIEHVGEAAPFQCDGEFKGRLPVDVCVLPGALTVFA